MELMEFLAAKMPDASRTKLKSLLSKRVVFVDNVITTQFNFPLQPGMKVQISKEKGKKEFNNRLLKICLLYTSPAHGQSFCRYALSHNPKNKYRHCRS